MEAVLQLNTLARTHRKTSFPILSSLPMLSSTTASVCQQEPREAEEILE